MTDKGVRITCVDLETGETAEEVITDDYVVITAGSRYLAGIQYYPTTGTTTVTIKTDRQAIESEPCPDHGAPDD